MNVLPQEIIRKKRLRQTLDAAEISQFFGGYLAGHVADYQVSAMLMAILLNGMTPEEAAALTLFMRDSGEKLDWPYDKKTIIDKHSTGGVGDKTSLILMPLCILEGLRVPMIAGRGLGHTGGTLDKLESIKGTNVFVSKEESKRLMQNNGGVFMGQTEAIAPLDRRLYALRDVTDTVESIPLITASILSKKLAEGIGGLVMDIKFGSGAFMQKKSDAEALALSIANVGRSSGIQVTCMLTDMGSPLGDRAGNALEIVECIEIMQGKGPASTRDLTLALAVEMLRLAQPSNKTVDQKATEQRLLSHLSSGRAFELFCKIIQSQGGDITLLEQPSKLPQAKLTRVCQAPRSGFVTSCDVRKLGLSVVKLGGGRQQAHDRINPAVGLSALKRQGDAVQKGEPLAIIHGDDVHLIDDVAETIQHSYTIGDRSEAEPLVWKTLS
jgi:thymidine phosphorylase